MMARCTSSTRTATSCLPGQAGEIYFEGGFDFEYLNDPAKTASSRDSHGWKTVGDIGYLDEDGLPVPDRPPPPHDHLRRGEHLSAGGREHAGHPSEGDGRRGVRHPRRRDGPERSRAWCRPSIRPTPPTNSREELLTWLRDRLAHYKCPRSISFEAQLPRTDTGKLYKQELIDKYSVVTPLRVVDLSERRRAGLHAPGQVVVAVGDPHAPGPNTG